MYVFLIAVVFPCISFPASSSAELTERIVHLYFNNTNCLLTFTVSYYHIFESKRAHTMANSISDLIADYLCCVWFSRGTAYKIIHCRNGFWQNVVKPKNKFWLRFQLCRAVCWNSRGPPGEGRVLTVCHTTTGQVDWRKRVSHQENSSLP